MSQQGLRQQSVRAVTSTTLTYEGDWHALFDDLLIADGTFNERLLAYINGYLETTYTELNGAMAALAAEIGTSTFQAIGTFTADGGGWAAPGGDEPLMDFSDTSNSMYVALLGDF